MYFNVNEITYLLKNTNFNMFLNMYQVLSVHYINNTGGMIIISTLTNIISNLTSIIKKISMSGCGY